MNDDEPFRDSCSCGHLSLAQWLYHLGDVDIHGRGSCISLVVICCSMAISVTGAGFSAKSDEAFRYACENGYLQCLYDDIRERYSC